MTLKEVIEHLKTLPQDMEVWNYSDELNRYSPLESPPARIDKIIQRPEHKRSKNMCWKPCYDLEEGKQVVVLQSPFSF